MLSLDIAFKNIIKNYALYVCQRGWGKAKV